MITIEREFINFPLFKQYGRVNVLLAVLLVDDGSGVVECGIDRLAQITGLPSVTVEQSLVEMEKVGILHLESRSRFHLRTLPSCIANDVSCSVQTIKRSLRKARCKDSVADEKPVAQKRFVPPTVEMVAEYVREKGYAVDPEYFIASNESKGWMRGNTKIKNWKALCRTWHLHAQSGTSPTNRITAYEQSRINRRSLLSRAEAHTTQFSEKSIAALLPG